ncbi:MAG: hypothetical protein V1792_09765 [Pseudomonadota bacterium]
MAYCPICGTDHDPDTLCVDKASDVSRRAGMRKRSKLSTQEFEELSRKATRSLLVFLLGAAGLGLLAYLFFAMTLPWLISHFHN